MTKIIGYKHDHKPLDIVEPDAVLIKHIMELQKAKPTQIIIIEPTKTEIFDACRPYLHNIVILNEILIDISHNSSLSNLFMNAFNHPKFNYAVIDRLTQLSDKTDLGDLLKPYFNTNLFDLYREIPPYHDFRICKNAYEIYEKYESKYEKRENKKYKVSHDESVAFLETVIYKDV
jgi:hypothetical protein